MNRKRIIIIALLISLLGLLLYSCYHLYQYSNGNTDAQIKAQERMKDVGEEMKDAMEEQGRWYKDRIESYN